MNEVKLTKEELGRQDAMKISAYAAGVGWDN